MSRIGRKPINIPEGVIVGVKGNSVNVKGKLGELSYEYQSVIKIDLNDKIIEVNRDNDEKSSRELHGLTRALIQNMINGVSEGYKKELELNGVGFTADAKKSPFLILNLGFSHPIYFVVPVGINITTPKPTQIIIEGIDKQQVGEVAAKIRSFRKPEPYKGKGVKYLNEVIRRKAGKSVGAGS
ncbi:MAG: 50S ribosomal protein L6 [Candidatus Marinimicrobia bacterium]|nr:50S ribosomal protein L6 [Candidatus Neomarinimicrobiota bacterium]|tara:strand:+ start:3015 stop:3563 length:549 start_codon:yes stop_codon:yes gene_type:complete